MLLGLCLGACKKGEQDSDNPSQENIVMIDGENYTLDHVLSTVAYITKTPIEELYYDAEKKLIKFRNSTMEIPIDIFKVEIKKLNNGGKL